MKKALLLVSILFISVVSTACINNFAVQELNNKAKAFIDNGDYQSAIERLKSSVDLDGSVYETHYNLAVAYTQAEDYKNAIDSYKKVIELNPDFADAYYSLAVAEEDYASGLAKGSITLDVEGNPIKVDEEKLAKDEENAQDKKIVITPAIQKFADELLLDAVKNYSTYLKKGVDLKDRDEVQERIDAINADKSKEPAQNPLG